MQATKHHSEAAVCQNCDAISTRIARIVRITPDGAQIPLMVCAFCYLQLGPKGKRRRV
jgi:hypothetical protein